MLQPRIRIRDARSAATAYLAIAKQGAPARLPATADEFKSCLHRLPGRARELADALRAFVDDKGFDALASAVAPQNRATAVETRADSQAAAFLAPPVLPEMGDSALIFAASGMY